MDISVVIPLLNEEESLPELVAWIQKVMKAYQFSYEIILVDDGSTDKSWHVIQQLGAELEEVKGIKFRRNYGKSAALNEGFSLAKGEVVVTMDADLQDSPDEIPELRKMIVEDGFDLVSGWKKERHDPISKTIPTKIYNAVTRWVTGVKLHDMNCGLKAYRNTVVKSIEVYGEMHRYIPVIAKSAGFNHIGEKVVKHQARKYGTTKFGLERFVNGFLDLMTIVFMSRFGKRPMHFFGLWGTVITLIGFSIITYLAIARLGFDQYKMTERPLFFYGLIMLIVGMQLFMTGFLGEMIGRSASDRNVYQVEDTILDKRRKTKDERE
ncbi:MAG: glycosyltransferase family 2 protein [Chitinophagales bacterium]